MKTRELVGSDHSHVMTPASTERSVWSNILYSVIGYGTLIVVGLIGGDYFWLYRPFGTVIDSITTGLYGLVVIGGIILLITRIMEICR